MAPDLEALYALPEGERNAHLRRLDWRFLLPGEEGPPKVAEIGFPGRRAVRKVTSQLPAGAVVVCRWRLPRLLAARRARSSLRAAGLARVSIHWQGPIPWRPPLFWLPLGSEAVAEHLLASRPPAGPGGRLLRGLWRVGAKLGLLIPAVAVGVVGDPGEPDEVTAALPGADGHLTLLTGGHRSINKVVGIAFEEDGVGPVAVLKAARVPEAAAGLEREAEVLATVARAHPEGAAVAPRIRAEGRRAGMTAVVESPLEGASLLDELTAETFAGLASEATDLLLGLAGSAMLEEPAGWWERIVGAELASLERGFDGVLSAAELETLRDELTGLGPLPVVCEHRDCSPWNVVRTAAGSLGLHDWESSEPRGLPALDLLYFLTTSRFVLDRAYESGTTLESYARTCDGADRLGAVAATCLERYRATLGIAAEDLTRLRLLCWVVHSRSDVHHLELEEAGPPAADRLAASPHLELLRADLARLRD